MINDLLDEFLYLFEQCNDIKFNKSALLTSNDYLELSSKIKSFFLQYNEDIESEFSSFLEHLENDKDLNYPTVEQFVDELRLKLDKYTYRLGYDFQEGIYTSANENLNIGAEWTSKSAIRFTNPSISVHQRPHKKADKIDLITNNDTEDNFDSKNECDKIIAPEITLETTIDKLDLPIRIFKCLQRADINTIEELITKTEEELRTIPDLGLHGLEALIVHLKSLGLSLKSSDFVQNISAHKKTTLDSPIEELNLSKLALNGLKWEGIKTIRELKDVFNGNIYCRRIGRSGLVEIINKLNEQNFNFVKICKVCGAIFINDGQYEESSYCKNCNDRYIRVLNAKDFEIEVLPPQKSSYLGNESGFHVYINIKNNTANPIKLELKECSIFKNGRQNASNYHLTGYSFTEEYIFPTTIKTFAKIWITDNWLEKDITYSDYLTILLKNSENSEQYYYKFNYFTEDGSWKLTDYYKIN